MGFSLPGPGSAPSGGLTGNSRPTGKPSEARAAHDMVKRLATLPLNFHPGDAWEYGRATDVVGRLVEVMSGQTFDDILSLKRFAAVEARSSQRATVLRECPVTLAVAERLTPSTRRLATCSNSRRVQRRPLYAVPVFVLTVSLQTVHRYRCRRPAFVANEP